MSDPYQADPDALAVQRKTAQETILISLQDEAVHPPPTIGSSAFQGMFFGPAAGQPSKAAGESRPSWGKVLLRVLFWLWVLGLLAGTIYRLAK